jgi:hypothetical protein
VTKVTPQRGSRGGNRRKGLERNDPSSSWTAHWTGTGPPDLRIGPGVTRTVDLGYIVRGRSRFNLGLIVLPDSGAGNLIAGSYTVYFMLAGGNFDPIFWSLTCGTGSSVRRSPTTSDHASGA